MCLLLPSVRVLSRRYRRLRRRVLSVFFWCVVCFFAEEREVCLSGVVLEEALECGADGAFVLFAELCVFFEFGVVVFDGFVGGFDVEGWHIL